MAFFSSQIQPFQFTSKSLKCIYSLVIKFLYNQLITHELVGRAEKHLLAVNVALKIQLLHTQAYLENHLRGFGSRTVSKCFSAL